MKKIVFIVGAGRSGSTLLCKTLGSHNDAFAVSELQNFKRLYNDNSHCSCGEHYSECNFWNKVLEEYNKTSETDKRQIPSLQMRLTTKKLFKRITILYYYLLKKRSKVYSFEEVDNTIKIYNIIFRNTGLNCIIDSGKDVFRALTLNNELRNKGWKPYFIYLVRDGRSVINSAMKKEVKMQWKGETQILSGSGRTFFQAFKSWLVVNIRTFLICNILIKNRFIKVKHEDLTKNPERQLKSIVKFLDIKYNENMLKLNCKIHHMMGGNASRINATRIRNVSVDLSNLTRFDKLVLTLFAGWLNKILGY